MNNKRNCAYIAALSVAFIGCVLLLVTSVRAERERVRAFCQPRGYVGGWIASRFEPRPGCIAANGEHVYIRDIQLREGK